MTLSDLNRHERFIIVTVKNGCNINKRLYEMGLLPHQPAYVKNKANGCLIVSQDGHSYAIGKGASLNISVKKIYDTL